MSGFFILIHLVVCLILVVIILMQSGRGGGLTEGFAAAESVFGAKTNEFMIKATAIAGVIFLVTSLTLAHLSSRAERSIMIDQLEQEAGELPQTAPLLPNAARSPEAGPLQDMEKPVN